MLKYFAHYLLSINILTSIVILNFTIDALSAELTTSFNSCLSGDSKNNQLTKKIQSGSNTPLMRKYNNRNLDTCTWGSDLDSTYWLEQTSSDLVTFLTLRDHLKKSCIASSMKRLSSISSANRLVCNSDDAVPKKIKYNSNSDVCVDKDVADLVYWTTNKMFDCVNSITAGSGSGKLDPAVFFKKINNESAFGFHLESVDSRQRSTGVGLGQLTSIAVSEIENSKIVGPMVWSKKLKRMVNRAGAQTYVEAAQDAPMCSDFKDIFKKSVLTKCSRGHGRCRQRISNKCGLISMPDGLARNLFYTMSYAARMRDLYIKPLLSNLPKDAAVSAKNLALLTLPAYGPNGLCAVKHSFCGGRRVIPNLELFVKKIGKKILTMTPDELEKQMADAGFVYVRNIRKKMKEYHDNYSEPNSDLMGSKIAEHECVE